MCIHSSSNYNDNKRGGDYSWTNDIYVMDDELFCMTCYNGHTADCEGCNERFDEEQLYGIEKIDGLFCEECKNTHKENDDEV